MPTLNDTTPEQLKPYTFHGMDLTWRATDKNAIGDCPWCGGEGKFRVRITDGLWRCLLCAEGSAKGGGNSLSFVRLLHQRSLAETTDSDYEELKDDRAIVNKATLKKWQVAKSILNSAWLIPGYNPSGEVFTLYKRGISAPFPTPTLGHHLHGVNLYKKKAKAVYLCEGPWDAMALWEVLGAAVPNEEDGLTYNPLQAKSCLRAFGNVLAVPGCNTFMESWLPLFKGKDVCILFDSDHPKKNRKTEKLMPPAGYTALKRIAGIVAKVASSVTYLHWGDRGYDPDLPTGHDVRDWLKATTGGLRGRVTRLGQLFGKTAEAPTEWLKTAEVSVEGVQLVSERCTDYAQLTKAWRDAMYWTDGLNSALACMLASSASTMRVGSQLWMKILGPASCGKSTLCEALSVNQDYVLAKSTIRGFHSGHGDGKEDTSLISQLGGKSLVTKDGDTLLQAPNLGQILSEGRDIYDTVSRTSYRNKASKDYSGVRMTWLLCGTSSLRSIDDSELGERFLDCVIMDGIDDEVEDRILMRVAERAIANMGIEFDGSAGKQYGPETIRAMQLTGGYVSYLREEASHRFADIHWSPEKVQYCTRLGKFVAYMRARPSKKQDESHEREFAARLVEQHIRLAQSLAVVMNKDEVDDAVIEVTRKVALDTSRGPVFDMTREMDRNIEGLEPRGVALLTALPDRKVLDLMKFLQKIGGVSQMGTSRRKKYTVSPVVRSLYREIVKGDV